MVEVHTFEKPEDKHENECIESAITILKEMLKLAQEGQIVRFVGIGEAKDGSTVTATSLDANTPIVMAGLTVLQHKLAEAVIQS